jgi:N-acyl-D-amino-acid deacylase
VLDVILTGGLVLDGHGTPAFATDIGVDGDRIVRVADCSGLTASTRIDCSGLMIAPGFIDMHGHSDEMLLANPLAQSKIRQGITCEVGGNCGTSPGPLSPQEFEDRRGRFKEQYDVEFEWRDIGGFLDALERAPAAMNFCTLVGLGDTRRAAGHNDADPLDDEALAAQCALVTQACEQGAIGVSSGLIYPPGRFADTGELAALAAAARKAGSPLYASHIRSEGDGLIEAVDEALEVGRRADVAVQLSHHKAAGKKNWGKVHDTLRRVDRARTAGLDVVLDQYPYKASSTGLDVILPQDVNVGERAEVLARLRDPRYYMLVRARVSLEYGSRWENVLIASVASEENKRFEGMTVPQIAAATGREPVDAALTLLMDEGLRVGAIYFTMCEDDVRTVLSYAHTAIGTDSVARAADGPTSSGKPHPRAYGTFPRVLKRYVRDAKLLSLEEAVRRCTTLAANRLGLRGRGAIEPGHYADLVVFDADAVADTATYEDPHRYPDGIPHVLVNGVAVVRDGMTTGRRPGRVLRRGRDL